MMFWKPSFNTDGVVLGYTDVQAAKIWWTDVSGCKIVKSLPERDYPLPSDAALSLPGDDDEPSIRLSSRIEAQEAGLEFPEHPIVFAGNLKKVHDYLQRKGAEPGPIQDGGGGKEFFEIRRAT